MFHFCAAQLTGLLNGSASAARIKLAAAAAVRGRQERGGAGGCAYDFGSLAAALLGCPGIGQ